MLAKRLGTPTGMAMEALLVAVLGGSSANPLEPSLEQKWARRLARLSAPLGPARTHLPRAGPHPLQKPAGPRTHRPQSMPSAASLCQWTLDAAPELMLAPVPVPVQVTAENHRKLTRPWRLRRRQKVRPVPAELMLAPTAMTVARQTLQLLAL